MIFGEARQGSPYLLLNPVGHALSVFSRPHITAQQEIDVAGLHATLHLALSTSEGPERPRP